MFSIRGLTKVHAPILRGSSWLQMKCLALGKRFSSWLSWCTGKGHSSSRRTMATSFRPSCRRWLSSAWKCLPDTSSTRSTRRGSTEVSPITGLNVVAGAMSMRLDAASDILIIILGATMTRGFLHFRSTCLLNRWKYCALVVGLAT